MRHPGEVSFAELNKKQYRARLVNFRLAEKPAETAPPELQKKRQLRKGNGEAPKRRRTLGPKKLSVKTISARDRAREFPEQPFRVVNNKLLCDACKMAEIDLKKDTIANHIKSNKHKRGLEQLAKKKDKKTQLMISAQSAQRDQFARGITSNSLYPSPVYRWH